MKKLYKIIIIHLFTLVSLSIVYPCVNCSIPVANAGDDFDVINGGVGMLDGAD